MKYYVLKPSALGNEGLAVRAALDVYASMIAREDPKRAREIRKWVASCRSVAAANGQEPEAAYDD